LTEPALFLAYILFKAASHDGRLTPNPNIYSEQIKTALTNEEDKKMTALRWVIAILTALVLALTLFISLPATAFVQQATNAQVAKTWFEQGNFYDKLLAAAFTSMFPVDDSIPFISNRQFEEAIREALPERFVQTSFETVLDAYYNYFNGRQERISFTVSLVEVEDNLKNSLPQILKDNIDVIRFPLASMLTHLATVKQ